MTEQHASTHELLEALAACADSLEAELQARYPVEAEGNSPYPDLKRRYDRDMADVLKARAVIARARRGGRVEFAHDPRYSIRD